MITQVGILCVESAILCFYIEGIDNRIKQREDLKAVVHQNDTSDCDENEDKKGYSTEYTLEEDDHEEENQLPENSQSTEGVENEDGITSSEETWSEAVSKTSPECSEKIPSRL